MGNHSVRCVGALAFLRYARVAPIDSDGRDHQRITYSAVMWSRAYRRKKANAPTHATDHEGSLRSACVGVLAARPYSNGWTPMGVKSLTQRSSGQGPWAKKPTHQHTDQGRLNRCKIFRPAADSTGAFFARTCFLSQVRKYYAPDTDSTQVRLFAAPVSSLRWRKMRQLLSVTEI
jgi:hypothetical protein